MDHFIDQPNKRDVIERIHNLNDEKDDEKDDEKIQEFISSILPNWLVYSTDNYSDDYPHLRSNWNQICKMTKTSPKKIVLVQDIVFDENHEVVKEMCEFMTKRGYVVRRAGEFIVCRTCMKAIPCIEVWHLLKEKGLNVPSEWSDKCRRCE